MQFRIVVAAAASLAVGTQAAVTAGQMTSNIDAITDLSSQTNDIAKSISVVNFFSTTPQVIKNFQNIIQVAANDESAMNNKAKRQECLNVANPQKCLADLEEIIEDPSEVLGDKRSVGSISARALAARQSTPKYDEAQQQAICSSFRGFVTVHQQLLATIIGKHGLLSLTPFTQPMAQVLRVLEGGVDTLAFSIINSVPTCAQDATQNKNSLDGTLGQAIDIYSD